MKKFLTFILVLAMVMSVSSFAMAAGVTALSGSGSEVAPYMINNLEDLKFFRDSVNAGETKYNAPGVYVALGADIDLAGEDWSVNIGDDCNKTFDGIFDGQNHTIYNMTSIETAQKADGYVCTGLFGAIYGSAVVKNLTIENVTINTGSFTGNNVGAVVGFVYNGTGSIENVSVCGDININAEKVDGVGAIVGYVYNGSLTVKNCVVDGNSGSSITGQTYTGGVIGYAGGKTIIDNSTVQDLCVTAKAGVGGVAGILLSGGEASDSTVTNVVLTATHDNWKESAAAVVGCVTGPVTVSDTTLSNVSANGAGTTDIVGSEHKDKPTEPVKPVEASVNDTYYPTLDGALNNANKGDTITLLTDDKKISDIPSNMNVTVVDSKGNTATIKNGIKIYPVKLNFGTKQIGYSGVTTQTVTIEGANSKPAVTVNNDKYNIGEVQDSSGNYTFTVQPKDGLGLGVHNASITVTVDDASPSPATVLSTIEAEFTVESKPGSGISVKYNGGNSFSTSNSAVPTGVEIDGVPVSFTGNGSNFTVSGIPAGAKWITIRWNSTSVTTNFTPNGAYFAEIDIPKTGDMSIWAAIAEFFGF